MVTTLVKRLRMLALCALAVLVPVPSPAQQIEGYVDLEQSIETQIAKLEQLVGGDASARKQVVVLQWLIDLYDSLGQQDEVERCYNRILAFFPNDVGTLNAYGRYLMDTVGDYGRARKVLYDANQWAHATDPRAIDLGTTYQLRSEVMRRMGDYEDALAHADKALLLFSGEHSGEALRTKARTLVALERFEEAAAAYLDLIALEGGANREDINELKLILPDTETYDAGDINRHIADAIEAHRAQYEARIELAGGMLVRFESSDGVALEGTLRRADGPGAVLLVNDTGARRSEFTPFAQLLMIDGISSLSVDLRGHGGSRADSMLSYEALSAYNRDHLADDVVAAFRYLEGILDIAPSRIAVVAAGTACAVVETALYRDGINAPIVYLSPSFPDGDPELRTALAFHPDHPALVIAAREDLSALRATARLRDGKQRQQLTTEVYPDAGHGLESLRRVPDALEDFQNWLRDVVGSS